MKRITLCAMAALSTLAFLPSARAADVDVTVPVRYGDLNLQRPGDVSALYHRLKAAALQACGASEFSVAPYRDAVEHSACYRQSLARAVEAVDLPAVAALHQSAGTTLASN